MSHNIISSVDGFSEYTSLLSLRDEGFAIRKISPQYIRDFTIFIPYTNSNI